MEIFYLGQKDDQGTTRKIFAFELVEEGEKVKVTEVPPRNSEVLGIQTARSCWKKLVADGFRRSEKRVAIAVSARINDELKNAKGGVKIGSIKYGYIGTKTRPDDDCPFGNRC